MKRVLIPTLATLIGPAQGFADAPNVEEISVHRIAPLFHEKFLACHGKDEAKIEGGLDMRTRASTLKGGESEQPGFVAGKPEESPLYLAVSRVHQDDWEPMPPKEADKLYAEQMGWIKEWIAGGAPWPDEARVTEIAKANEVKWSAENGNPVKTVGGLSAEWTNRKYKPEGLWAYQKVASASAEPNGDVGLKPKLLSIDAFISAKMPAGLQPAPAGSFAANALGLFDMSGNVWQWCDGLYKAGSRWGVLRGGSWGTAARGELRSSYRNVVDRSERDVIYGFRCVLVPDGGR